MSFDIMDLDLPLQKTLDAGEIDRWLRGLAAMVPRASDPKHDISQERDLPVIAGMTVTELDMNTHVLGYGSYEKIKEADIEKMVGFTRLTDACKQGNVRIDIINHGKGSLEVTFEPEESFSSSRVFNRNFANVVPFSPKPAKAVLT